MNILMISHRWQRGAFARSHAMAWQLVQKGHHVTLVLVSEYGRLHFKEYEWEGVHTVDTPDMLWGRMRSGWDPWNALSRIYFLNRDKTPYDLVHCFETRPATIYPALFFVKRKGLPLLTDWNDWYGRKGLIEVNRPKWYRYLFGWVETYYEEAFRAKAAGLTVISKSLAQRALQLGVSPERLCHIPGGAFLDWFVYRSKQDCRRHVGLSEVDIVLGFSSADSHLDMRIVFASLAIVAHKYPNVKLMITGKVKQSVLSLAEDCKVLDRLWCVGYLPFEELPWYLGCADIFLLPMEDRPYNRGRWPNKMCDYMSLGRPTVANPVGDIKDLFDRHQVGYTADWDENDFAEKIMMLIANPEQCEVIGRSARQVVEQEYDWRILAGKLFDFYQLILSLEHSKGPRFNDIRVSR